MSFVQAGDIVRALELLKWIYEQGFVRENSADVRYENFRSDVQDFDDVLQDLNTALKDASARYRARGASSALNPQDPAFENERRRLIGAFEVTLAECQNVLRHKIEPQRNAQGILQNLKWAAGTEDKVNELRSRLQFHMQKMLLVVNRLSLRLMTDSADVLDDILGLSEQSIVLHGRTQALLQQFFTLLAAHLQGQTVPNVLAAGRLPTIPPALDKIFDSRLPYKAPLSFARADYDVREIPIEEGFDALMSHFSKSADSSAGSQTPEQYVQLLKAVWLVQKIIDSQDYQNARPGYYYRRAVVQIEQQLFARLQAPRLVAFEDDILSALEAHTYEIWPSPGAADWVSVTDPKPGEREEIRLYLALESNFTQQEIVVFRKSEHTFRIVQENKGEHNGQIERQQIPLHFDLRRDHFVPFYAMPSGSVGHEVAFSTASTGDFESYRFRTSGDLYKFQEIILGQRMVAEDKNVTFEFSNGIKGNGRIQIWQEPIEGPSNQAGQSIRARHGSHSSSSSPVSPNSFNGSRVGSIAPSTITEHAEGAESGTVPLPSLVIFTEIDRKLSFIYVKLERGMRIIRAHCDCRNGQAGYARCCSLSLAREDNKGRLTNFPTPTLVAKADSSGRSVVSTCDLAVFRLPTHPNFRNLQKRKAEHLYMTFDTPQIKDAFNVELHDRFKLRDRLFQQLSRYDDTMQYEAERPEASRGSRAPPPNANALSRVTSSRSTASRAPSIGSLQLGGNFGDEVARGTDPPGQRASVARPLNGTVVNDLPMQRTSFAAVFNGRPNVSAAPHRAHAGRSELPSSSALPSELAAEPEPWQLSRADTDQTIRPIRRPSDRMNTDFLAPDWGSSRHGSLSNTIGRIFPSRSHR